MSGRILTLLVGVCAAGPASGDDWPQWMGPNRDGVWDEAGIVETFPAGGPKKLWSAPVKGGYAGPAVAGGRVYLTDYDRVTGEPSPRPQARNKLTGLERVQCFSARTGHPIWKHEYDCRYDLSFPAGPRCTPTVDGEYVYTLGAMGHLYCLTAKGGSVVWKKDLAREYRIETTPIWGFTGHPLVYKDTLICLVGGPDALLVAFDKKTGAERWRALSAKSPGYSPPTMVRVGQTRQLVVWYPDELVGLNPDTGEKYWEILLKPSYGMSVMTPRVLGDVLFAGGHIGVAVAVKLGTSIEGIPTATVLWKGKRDLGLYPVTMTPFLDAGVIYGCDQPGAFRACKLSTGERLWASMVPVTGTASDPEQTKVHSGTAFVIKNGDRFFLFAETGHLIIAELSAKGYREVSRVKLLEPTGTAMGRNVVWSHPAFAEKCVFARNDREMVCYSLAK